MELRLENKVDKIEVGDVIISRDCGVRMIIEDAGKYMAIGFDGETKTVPKNTIEEVVKMYDIKKIIKNEDLVLSIR